MPRQLFSPLERLFSLPERGSAREAIQISQHRESARISACERLPARNERPPYLSTTEMDSASRASAAGLGCVRGTSFALLIEAGAALLVYGILQVWHLFR
jgi:hypothetical protein